MSSKQYVGDPLGRPSADGTVMIFMPHVCVIESPSEKDKRDERREGIGLSESLELAGIRNKLYSVESLLDLHDAFEDMASFNSIKLVTPNRPLPWKLLSYSKLFLHFSCHGNEDGLFLTDETHVPWSDLRTLILTLGRKAGLFFPEHFPVCQIAITMSVCHGLHARRMVQYNICPFMFLVGAAKPITWTDALTSFVVFYHHIIHKKRHLEPAVRSMNAASMLRDVFRGLSAADVNIPGLNKSQQVTIMRRNPNGMFGYMLDATAFVTEPLRMPRDNHKTPSGEPLTYFDDPHEAYNFMMDNLAIPCQIEMSAAIDLMLYYDLGPEAGLSSLVSPQDLRNPTT